MKMSAGPELVMSGETTDGMEMASKAAEVSPVAPAAAAAVAQFSTVDYTVFGLMLAMSLAIGVFSAIKGRVGSSTQQFLMGGRVMAPIPVALSLIGGVFSGVSILGLLVV